MIHVAVALLPGLGVSVWLLGSKALIVVVISTVAAVITEVVGTRSFQSVRDGSAVITGMLIGLCLPPTVALWIPIVAAISAITLGKLVFGGLGKNLFNPAMVGYALVLVAFPMQLIYLDGMTGATALDVLKHHEGDSTRALANHPAFGSIGARQFEWLNLAFLVGGIYLVLLRIVPWILPLSVLLGVVVPALVLYPITEAHNFGTPWFHLFAGGTMLTAFFIATDPVTSPSTKLPQIIFGFFVGSVAFFIRCFGTWADGFAFAILLGNALLPILEPKRLSSS
ncbi:MAG: RnfABCDGE type electron transport complex subunit D [Gammaproteobacteria bacterium]|nr:RnfABCDGE type electron transport complex subunit D [Gammaproteobacteria bacterium]MYF38097.1 RnfABCDGE type electron transport complex subunit D [Gammaproteobacteria bacterium]